MNHRFLTCGLLGILVATLAGCRGRDARLPDLVPVEGTVTWDRQPLSGALVTFVPTGATRGQGATGYTDAAGHYALQSVAGGDGVPAGEYRVIITKLEMPDGSDFPLDSDIAPMDSPARQVLPDRYSDDGQTGLTASVPATGGTIDFPLTSGP